MAEGTEKETAASTTAKKTQTTPARGERKCSVEGCKRPYRAKSYCVVHYNTWRRGEMENHKARFKACSKEGCKKPAGRWGLCAEHGKSGEAAEATPAA